MTPEGPIQCPPIDDRYASGFEASTDHNAPPRRIIKRFPITQSTHNRMFYLLIIVVGLLLLRLVFAYLAVLMFATVVVLVTWPIFAHIGLRTGRPGLSAILTASLLGAVVVPPALLLGVTFVQQALRFGRHSANFVEEGGIARGVESLKQSWANLLPASLSGYLPDPAELTVLVGDAAQTAALAGLQTLTTKLPSIIAFTTGFSIEAFVFVFAVPTLYAKGPDALVVLRDLVPLEDGYVDELLVGFASLANRAFGGTIAVAVLQGAVATIGYAIAGVDGLVFFGSLTALFSLVPVVGGALIYLPLVVWTWIQHGMWWGVFLLAWQVLLTSQVDTFIRPLFLRGGSSIHPLLIFLSVFGGLGWLGLPGVLAGPLIITVFTALYEIYRRDFVAKVDAHVAPSI